MAPPTMKAAICKELGQPLTIEQIPTPKPQGRELLVRVKVATVCHSDSALVDTGLGLSTFPLIPGHEAVSVVEELGPSAGEYGIKVGDLVGAPAWHDICFSCMECKEVGTDFCSRMLMKGVTTAGYFAEYTTVDAAVAVVLPKDAAVGEVAQLSPLFCAGVTVWDALGRAEVKLGEAVGIVGVGGLGEAAVRYAHALGMKVFALDVNEKQLQGVLDGGYVQGVVNTKGLTPAEAKAKVKELNGGRPLDVVLVTAGAGPAYQTALSIIRSEGRVIAVGIPEQNVPIPMSIIATYAIKIIGSKVPDQIDCARCVEFSHRKGIFPRVNPKKFQLEDINEMLDLMRAGKVEDGRMAIRFF